MAGSRATSRSGSSASRAGTASGGGRNWDQPIFAPVVLVRGPEEYLRELATAGVVAKAREALGPFEKVEVSASGYQPGQLQEATSPSLFGDPKVVIITDVDLSEAIDNDLIAYLAAPDPSCCVIVIHNGGQRGKKLLTALANANVPQLECAELKKPAEKASFIRQILKNEKRKVTPEAVTALIDAVGEDLRQLAAATKQLTVDIDGDITANAVNQYYAGRIQATTFQIADAALAGDTPRAIALLRQALAQGLKGPELTAVLALKLRTLAKVAAAHQNLVSNRELRMPDWQIRNANTELRSWRPQQLAAAFEAIAQADHEVKGGAASASYALEKVVLAISQR